jgi:hypothetical protein
MSVWRGVFDWLGVFLQFPQNFQSLLNFTGAASGRKQINQALVMVWGAVFWALWQHRNHIVFVLVFSCFFSGFCYAIAFGF